MTEMDEKLLCYKSVRELAKIMSVSYCTAYNRVKEMAEEQEKGTYPAWVLVKDGSLIRCWLPAFLHYENERKWLRNKAFRCYAKPFHE